MNLSDKKIFRNKLSLDSFLNREGKFYIKALNFLINESKN
jgi:hypothetical protein